MTLAYGVRQVRKLVDVLEMENASLSEQMEAIQLLCDISSSQERKAEAAEDIGHIIMHLLNDDAVELVLGACKLIQSLSKILQARKSMKEDGVFQKLTSLIRHSTKDSVKLQAAMCIKQLTFAPDGMDAFVTVENTINILVRYLKDSTEAAVKENGASSDSGERNVKEIDDNTKEAILVATQAVCSLTVREKFLVDALKNGVHLPIIEICKLKLMDNDIKTACCTLLSHLCHHTDGKLAVLRHNGLDVLTNMLDSKCVSVRQRATGAIAGLTIEKPAKMITMNLAGPFLVRLVNDTDAIVASNALICLENCCEIPDARDAMVKLLHEDTKLLLKDFICWPKPHDMKRKEIRPFPLEDLLDIS